MFNLNFYEYVQVTTIQNKIKNTSRLQTGFFVLHRSTSPMMGFPGGSEVKAYARNAGDLGSIPGLGRAPGEGNSNPLQYSCLENPEDGGAWWGTVYEVVKSQTRLSD